MTATARAISAAIRADMAKLRISQTRLAVEAGLPSQTYVSVRLCDKKPFTLDDVESIARVLGWHTPLDFLNHALAETRQPMPNWPDALTTETHRESGVVCPPCSPDHWELRA